MMKSPLQEKNRDSIALSIQHMWSVLAACREKFSFSNRPIRKYKTKGKRIIIIKCREKETDQERKTRRTAISFWTSTCL
ncbi:Uncharacterized protein APZ42_028312 [Daphnia magna]|uniref:Uncharacterized protein n=1 Tax=Daphnia magna TaxID=35525 RepID=A0A164QNQ2_9CRUS|nr:Uncharacterized protein APZ42_028312 [Daphnia magna]